MALPAVLFGIICLGCAVKGVLLFTGNKLRTSKITLQIRVFDLYSSSCRAIYDVLDPSRAVSTAGSHCLQWNRCISYERVCLSVCLSVTFPCFVEKNEATIVRFSPSVTKIILVPGEVQIVWKFAADHPSEGVEVRSSTVASENLTNNEP